MMYFKEFEKIFRSHIASLIINDWHVRSNRLGIKLSVIAQEAGFSKFYFYFITKFAKHKISRRFRDRIETQFKIIEENFLN